MGATFTIAPLLPHASWVPPMMSKRQHVDRSHGCPSRLVAEGEGRATKLLGTESKK